MKIQDKHFIDIKKIYPDIISFNKPATSGKVHYVYIIENPTNKYVCRFSNKNIAKHNLQTSKLLISHNIPVPDVSIYDCGNYYCETYPFISGKTFHERLLEGLSGEKLDNVYQQLFNISHKLSEIPYNTLDNISTPCMSEILRKTIALFNPSERKLCHSDLHAGNVILDEQDNVRALLDLDAVIPEYTSVAYFIMMREAYAYGYDLKRFESLNQTIKNLSTQVKAINFITKTYHFMVPNIIRKQLLKIRLK